MGGGRECRTGQEGMANFRPVVERTNEWDGERITLCTGEREATPDEC